MVFEVEEVVEVRSPSGLKWHIAKVMEVMGGGQAYLVRYVMVDKIAVVSPQRICHPSYVTLLCAIFMHEFIQPPDLVNGQRHCFINEGDRSGGGF
eukprot:4384373-Ditylum_brightwellii.AAC.1